jgi:outer membrane protein assembly factor BamB
MTRFRPFLSASRVRGVMIKRLAEFGLLATSSVLLMACQSTATKTPIGALPTIVAGATISTGWSTQLKGGGIGFSPVVVAGSVWAAAADGTVIKAELATGKENWRINVGKKLTAGVGTDGDVSVVVAADGEMIALDANGQKKWSALLRNEITSPPAVGLGSVLVRAPDNRVTAFDLDTGRQRWTFSRTSPPLVLRQATGIALGPATAYVGLAGGRLIALSVTDGAVRWDVPMASVRGATDVERMTDVVGSPLLIGREVCAVTNRGRIGCVDAANGAPLWLKDYSSLSGLEVDGRIIVAADDSSSVTAFATGGTVVWKQDGLLNRDLSAPLAIASVLALADKQGWVHFLNRSDGSIVGRVQTDGSPVVSPMATGRNMLVVQNLSGTITMVNVRD